jgi:tRNA modification GTPase
MTGDATSNRASLLTPPGRGAVAVIAADGRASFDAVDGHFRAANGRLIADQTIDRIAFGHWRDGDHAEEVIVCRTGDMQVEVHCHGGAAAVERILAALAAAGCLISPPSARGLAPEAASALAHAPTRRTAAILLDQQAGALQREIMAIRSDVAAGQIDEARQRLAKLADRVSLGIHLTRPWHVALAGAPNVGKSSLLNAILGYERAIVFDQPGTTRDVLDAFTAFDGWPVRLTDAAGMRDSADGLEAAGIARAREELARADLIVWVLDATTLAQGEFVAAPGLARLACAAELGRDDQSIPLLAVVNKIDLAPPPAPAHDANDDETTAFVSAFNGAGLDGLLTAIASRLVPVAPASGEPVPFTPRQFELIAATIECLDAGDATAAITALDRLISPSC